MIGKKTKYYVYFIGSASGVATVEKIKRISITTEIVSFNKDISHPIDIDKPTMLLRNSLIYVVDIKSGLISFDKNKTTIDIQMINKIVKQKIISQLTKSMDNKVNWLNVIISIGMGLGIGLFIGYILAGYV